MPLDKKNFPQILRFGISLRKSSPTKVINTSFKFGNAIPEKLYTEKGDNFALLKMSIRIIGIDSIIATRDFGFVYGKSSVVNILLPINSFFLMSAEKSNDGLNAINTRLFVTPPNANLINLASIGSETHSQTLFSLGSESYFQLLCIPANHSTSSTSALP